MQLYVTKLLNGAVATYGLNVERRGVQSSIQRRAVSQGKRKSGKEPSYLDILPYSTKKGKYYYEEFLVVYAVCVIRIP